MQTQAILFDTAIWSAADARKWLSDKTRSSHVKLLPL